MWAEQIEIWMIEADKSWTDPIGGVVGVEMDGRRRRIARDGGLKRRRPERDPPHWFRRPRRFGRCGNVRPRRRKAAERGQRR